MTRNRDTVLFDLYGTLADITVDEEQAAFWNHLASAARAVGVTTDGPSLRRRWEELCAEALEHRPQGAILDNVFPRLLANGSAPAEGAVEWFAHQFRMLSTVSLSLRPYAVPLLVDLKRHQVKTALTSNTEALLTRHDLAVLGIESFFDAIVLSSDLDIAGKPDVLMGKRALVDVGSDAASCVVVGDSEAADGGLARALGCPFVLVVDDPAQLPAPDEDVRPVTPALRPLEEALGQFGVPTSVNGVG